MSVAAAATDRLPMMRATIDQRIFITYRADPEAVRPLVPDDYELRLTDGMAMGGVCLIRLRHLRPSRLPRWVGLTSDNAAHRISIIGRKGEPAIWAPRRDTDSRVSAIIGKAMFPNAPGRAHFDRGAGGLDIRCSDRSGETVASIDASAAMTIPDRSLFSSTDEVRDYYRAARRGYSPSTTGADGTIDLDIEGWRIEALDVARAYSSVFAPLIESGRATLDHAVRVRNLDSTWRFGHC